MKQQAIRHEVLVFTNTYFSKRQFSEKSSNEIDPAATGHLENACWNGLVFDMLPGITGSSSYKSIHNIWEVSSAGNFIEVKLGSTPFSTRNKTSLNPHLFLPKKILN